MSIVSQSKIRPAVRHIVRQIARVSNPSVGYQSVEETDQEIGSLLMQGYRLVNTHYLGQQIDHSANMNYIGILYILQLEQGEIEKAKREKIEG